MKLNPFSKKSGYYARIKAEHAEEQRKLDALNTEVTEAQADYEAKAQASADLERRNSGKPYLSDAESAARRMRDEAYQRAEELRSKVFEQQRKTNELRHIIEGPDKLEQSRAAIIDLRHRRGNLQAERAQSEKLIAKIDKRIGELEQRIAAETQSASEAMAAAESEFALPETLTRLDVELRVAHTTRTNLASKVQTLDEEIKSIPEQLRQAERTFEHAQATVAEIDLNEQLPNLYDLLARASVADHACGYRSRNEYKYEIEIPHDHIEAARAKLAAEMPGYTGAQ